MAKKKQFIIIKTNIPAYMGFLYGSTIRVLMIEPTQAYVIIKKLAIYGYLTNKEEISRNIPLIPHFLPHYMA